MTLSRCCRLKYLFVAGIIVNIVTLLYIYYTQVTPPLSSTTHHEYHVHKKKYHNSSSHSLTLVVFDFEHFCNDIPNVVRNSAKLLPNMKIVIISEKKIYPPLIVNRTGYSEYIDTINLYGRSRDHRPEDLFSTEYVLISPDGLVINTRNDITKAVNNFNTCYPNCRAVALNIDKHLECLHANVSVKTWTLHYTRKIENTDFVKVCNFVNGAHVILMKSIDYLDIPKPFLRPFPEAIYIFFAARVWYIYIYSEPQLSQKRDIFSDQSMLWRHREEYAERRKDMLNVLGIKLITHIDGTKEWHGCTKETNRCFGSIIDDTPEYIYEQKWTPPCCLEAVRITGRHVFTILDRLNIRYWLEGGSLLGAARNGDIIPWDYDIDIGIYRDDIPKCDQLVRATQGSFIDDDEFLWEKALEGDFYRVQFSEANHMHVDLFPFYSRNGTMTKDTWFATHRQDCEFPEHYLQPLTRIKFVDYSASAPNNVRDFLEFKFGKGVIEISKYPNHDHHGTSLLKDTDNKKHRR